MKSNFAENMISLVSFVYNVLTQADPQRSSALQEMFVFLSRVLAKHTRARQERGGGVQYNHRVSKHLACITWNSACLPTHVSHFFLLRSNIRLQ